MKVGGVAYRTIWPSPDGDAVEIIDQTRLPHEFTTCRLESLNDVAAAIRTMQVRGAPLIGAAAACGVWLALRADSSDAALAAACEELRATRPTAVNLAWALDEVRAAVAALPPPARAAAARERAAQICDQDVEICRAIGEHGLQLLRGVLDRKKGERIEVLTHCNAGWLATVDWGTALAPLYLAHDAGIDVHVWVDETRPRNQGAALTAWELDQHGVPHTLIADNAGAHLMQQGRVDLVIVGTDRTAANGDIANKIGTYPKALAAQDNGVAFYVAVPPASIDWACPDGSAIPIEQRDPSEVTHVAGATETGELATVRIAPATSPAANPAFDVTPARLITGLITDRGICRASRAGLLALYPERHNA